MLATNSMVHVEVARAVDGLDDRTVGEPGGVPVTCHRSIQPGTVKIDGRRADDTGVWDLNATDDSRLVVAGQFTSVNGQPNTTGVAMLDAATGAVDLNWRVTLGLTGSTRWPIARTLDIDDGKVYVGGNFTRIAGSNGVVTQVIQAARVDLSTGNVDPSFRPNFDGIVFDIDADAGRVYAVGNFLYVNGAWSIGLAVLHASNGALVNGLQPWVRTSVANTQQSYQHAVLALNDQIWQVGAQHNRQVYRPSDYSLIRSWVSHPFGDGQALATLFADSTGCLWTGGDFNRGRFDGGTPRYVQGFAKFCAGP